MCVMSSRKVTHRVVARCDLCHAGRARLQAQVGQVGSENTRERRSQHSANQGTDRSGIQSTQPSETATHRTHRIRTPTACTAWPADVIPVACRWPAGWPKKSCRIPRIPDYGERRVSPHAGQQRIQ